MVEWLYIISLAAFGLVTLALLMYIAYLLLRKPLYTRERFAFISLWANVAVIMVLLPTFAGPEPLWVVGINLICKTLGINYQTASAGLYDKILCLFSFVVLAMSSTNKFKNWNSEISERQLDQMKKNIDTSIVKEGFWETARLIKRLPPPKLGDKANAWHFDKVWSPSAPLPWRHRARELICLKRPSFRINAEQDWHEKFSLWLGENPKDSSVIGIYCAERIESTDQCAKQILYMQGIANGRSIELIAAGREFSCQSGMEQGVEVQSVDEETLLSNLVDFDDYFYQIESSVTKKFLPDSSLTLSNVYVSSRLTYSNGNVASDNLDNYLFDWLKEEGERQLAILGGYGQGKSTGVLMMAYNIIQRIKAGEDLPVPVIIELRGKSPASLTPLELMGTWAALYGIDPRAVMRLLEAGRVVIIFDAFDEMTDAGTSEARVAHFAALWRLKYPNSKILFTGRPHFLLDEREIKSALGIEKNTAAGPYCEALEIALFDLSRIEKSLRSFPSKVRNGIVEMASKDVRFADIVARPSLLYAVAQMWDDPDFVGRIDSITSGSVLSLFVHHSYRRQTEKLRLGQNFMPLGENERAFFMLGIACYMANRGLPNQIKKDTFEAAVGKLYEHMPVMEPNFSLAVKGPSLRPLKVRMSDDPAPLEKIITDVRTYGILENDPIRIGALRFAHKSFFEIIFAEYLVHCVLDPSNSAYKAVSLATGVSPANAGNVRNSVDMCADIIISKRRFNFNSDRTELFHIILGRKWILMFMLMKVIDRLKAIFDATFERYLIGLSLVVVMILILSDKFFPTFFFDFFEFMGLGDNQYFTYISYQFRKYIGGVSDFAKYIMNIIMGLSVASVAIDLTLRSKFVKRYRFLEEILRKCCAVSSAGGDYSSHSQAKST